MTALLQLRHIGVVLGVLLLAGLGWFFWPFVSGPDQMQSFCGSLEPGTSITQVKAKAAEHGYRVSVPVEGRAFVHDPGSFGRFTCNVQFGPDGLISSDYFLND